MERVRVVGKWIEHYRRRAEQEHPIDTIRQVLRELDYEGWLYEKSSSDRTGQKLWGNVTELVDWLARLHQENGAANGLSEMVAHLRLQDVLDRQDEESGGDQAHLMTLHSAKGLEFPHLFLVGVEEEPLPHRSSTEEKYIEEERRLAYVGITRARQTLTISYARKRKRYGELVHCEPSRFLDELPKEVLSREGEQSTLTPGEKKQRGNAHLASMRSLLG